MMVSELLYVGSGPEMETKAAGVERCATAQEAAATIRTNTVAVVPTTDVARDTLVLLGYGQAWATFATNRNAADDDIEVFLQ